MNLFLNLFCPTVYYHASEEYFVKCFILKYCHCVYNVISMLNYVQKI